MDRDLPYYNEDLARQVDQDKMRIAENDGGKQQSARELLARLQENENQKVIKTHLEQSYEQALRVEEFNASIRKLISAKLLMSRRDLSELTNVRDKAQKTILTEHESYVES